MRVLVVARDRAPAEAVALKQYPPTHRVRRQQWKSGDVVVDVGIFGQDLHGRTYDRIVVAQQKMLPPAYSNHLMFRLKPGGRFERTDQDGT